jgi:hypothetical protein
MTGEVTQVRESTDSGYAGVAARSRGMGPLLLGLVAALVFASSARAATQVPLGTAEPFAVLAGSTVTNTGPTVINGDLGLSPGTSVTGFPPGTVNGSQHVTDAVPPRLKPI